MGHMLVQLNRIEAVKGLCNALAPDNAKINVCTRQLFIIRAYKLQLNLVGALQNSDFNSEINKFLAQLLQYIFTL
jgi:hypothetical protein